jgi:hypothetical protein
LARVFDDWGLTVFARLADIPERVRRTGNDNDQTLGVFPFGYAPGQDDKVMWGKATAI